MPGRGRKRPGKPPSAGAAGRSSGPIRQNQTVENNDQPDPERMAADFERELVWCIQQLEFGLTSAKNKPEGRQAEEAVKLLKILQNPKAPVIKKRQVMRNTFGDYRKKMADEEKKHGTAMKKMKLEAVSGDQSGKSKFLKKASHTVLSDATPGGSTMPHDVTSLMSNLSFTGGGDASFKFDFKPEENDNNDKDCGDNTSTQNTEVAEPGDSSQPPAQNYYKMSVTDNTFRFNFTAAET